MDDKQNDAVDKAEAIISSNCKFDEIKTDMDILINMLGEDTQTFNSKKIIDFIITFNKDNKRFLYSQISAIIYSLKKKNEENKIINIQINIDVVIKDLFQMYDDINHDLIKMTLKLYDHINLASMQYSNLVDTEEEFKNKINPFVNELNEKIKIDIENSASDSLNLILDERKQIIAQLGCTVKDLKKEFDSSMKITIAESKQTIHSEMFTNLITVLGIFTAISFMIFGSWNMIDLTLTKFEKISDTMITWSLLVLGVATILLTLLWGVSKLTERPIFNKDNSKKFIIFSYIVCIVILFTGIGFKCYEIYNIKSQNEIRQENNNKSQTNIKNNQDENNSLKKQNVDSK